MNYRSQKYSWTLLQLMVKDLKDQRRKIVVVHLWRSELSQYGVLGVHAAGLQPFDGTKMANTRLNSCGKHKIRTAVLRTWDWEAEVTGCRLIFHCGHATRRLRRSSMAAPWRCLLEIAELSRAAPRRQFSVFVWLGRQFSWTCLY
jgi:hypothetical protein